MSLAADQVAHEIPRVIGKLPVDGVVCHPAQTLVADVCDAVVEINQLRCEWWVVARKDARGRWHLRWARRAECY